MGRLPNGARGRHINRARRLRAEMGVSETIVWDLLRDRKTGFKWRRQVPVGDYILDFYCAEANLALEVDGPHHELRQERDAQRDDWFLSKGVKTVRVPTFDIFDEASKITILAWLDVIIKECELRAGRKAFPD